MKLDEVVDSLLIDGKRSIYNEQMAAVAPPFRGKQTCDNDYVSPLWPHYFRIYGITDDPYTSEDIKIYLCHLRHIHDTAVNARSWKEEVMKEISELSELYTRTIKNDKK